MPEPSSLLSTDGILYSLLYEPLSKQLCFLNPNWITISCFLMLGPIIYGLEKGWSLGTLLGIMFLRQSLDCLDGAVARSCNKKTKLGATLDVAEDTATVFIFGGYITWLIWCKRDIPEFIKQIVLLLWITGLGVFSYNTYTSVKGGEGIWPSLFHDNTVLLSLGITWFAYKVKN